MTTVTMMPKSAAIALMTCVFAINVTLAFAGDGAKSHVLYLSCIEHCVDVDEKIVLIETIETAPAMESALRLNYVGRKIFKMTREASEDDSPRGNGERRPPFEELTERSANHFSHGEPLPEESSFHASRITRLSFSEPGEYHIKVTWTLRADEKREEMESNTLKVIVRKADKKGDKDAAKQ